MPAIDLSQIANSVYSQQDEAKLTSRMKALWVSVGVFIAIIVVTIVWSLFIRIQWLTMLLTIAFGSAALFLWSMKLAPVICYKRHMRDIKEGLSRHTSGVVVSFDSDMTLREGIECHALIVNVGDINDPKDERLYYWDSAKPSPEVRPGDKVELTSHGNDIIGFKVDG